VVKKQEVIDRIEKIKRLLEENQGKEFTVAEISKETGIPPRQVRRIVRTLRVIYGKRLVYESKGSKAKIIKLLPQ
jgi:DNA-directed RNA polymerase sigma subunit (sigma70/sigma32)